MLPSPLELSLPITTFTEEELTACGDGAVIREAQGIRQMLADAAEVHDMPPPLMPLVHIMYQRNFEGGKGEGEGG